MELTSGTFDIPNILKHPGFLNWEQHHSLLTNIFCYIHRHDDPGISLLVNRKNDSAIVQVGDWFGNIIDVLTAEDDVKEFVKSDLSYYINLASVIKLDLVQFYFTKSYKIFDVQVSLNKFAGPGMVKDVFGSKLSSLETVDITILNDKIIDDISKPDDKYSGSLIIRPSRFRLVDLDNGEIPLYVRVR